MNKKYILFILSVAYLMCSPFIAMIITSYQDWNIVELMNKGMCLGLDSCTNNAIPIMALVLINFFVIRYLVLNNGGDYFL